MKFSYDGHEIEICEKEPLEWLCIIKDSSGSIIDAFETTHGHIAFSSAIQAITTQSMLQTEQTNQGSNPVNS